MTLKMSDQGLDRILQGFVASTVGQNAKVHLFQNDYVPSTADTVANYVEANFPGYAAAAAAPWSASVIAGHVDTVTGTARAFVRNASGAVQNIFGYYVTDGGGATLLWAERDPTAPVPMINNGDSYTITARITAQDLST